MSSVLCAGFWAPKDRFPQLRLSPVKLNLLPRPLVILRPAWDWWERDAREEAQRPIRACCSLSMEQSSPRGS